MIDEKVIRERIQKACVAKGYTRYQLAKKSCVPYNSICRFLDGKVGITLYMLQNIDKALQSQCDDMLPYIDAEQALLSVEEWQMIHKVRNLNKAMQNVVYNLITECNKLPKEQQHGV